MEQKMKMGLTLLMLVLMPAIVHSAMTGEEIYKKHVLAEKNMETKLSSMIMEVKSVSEQTEFSSVVYTKGNKSRIESTVVKSNIPMMGKAGDKSIIINDGQRTTVFSPQMGKHTTTNELYSKEDYETPPAVEFLGKETVSNIPCYKLRLTFDTYGDSRIVWISAKDFVMVKELYPGNDETIELHSDFRDIKGIKIPFTTQSYEGENLVGTSTVQNLKVDARIDDDLFNPDQVKGFKAEKPNKESEQAMNNLERIMSMSMQLQTYYQNGEIEKAKALEKELEEMTRGD